LEIEAEGKRELRILRAEECDMMRESADIPSGQNCIENNEDEEEGKIWR
jgi:hypothetical protein